MVACEVWHAGNQLVDVCWARAEDFQERDDVLQGRADLGGPAESNNLGASSHCIIEWGEETFRRRKNDVDAMAEVVGLDFDRLPWILKNCGALVFTITTTGFDLFLELIVIFVCLIKSRQWISFSKENDSQE